jgi:hypothetical protein
MVYPKFIIVADDLEGDYIVLGKCTYHKQLAPPNATVKGGGWWTLDAATKEFTLSGKSEDFGRAELADVVKCVQTNRVFANYAQVRNLTDEHTFSYVAEDGTRVNLEQRVQAYPCISGAAVEETYITSTPYVARGPKLLEPTTSSPNRKARRAAKRKKNKR